MPWLIEYKLQEWIFDSILVNSVVWFFCDPQYERMYLLFVYVLTATKYDFTYENIGGHGEGKSYAIILCVKAPLFS